MLALLALPLLAAGDPATFAEAADPSSAPLPACSSALAALGPHGAPAERGCARAPGSAKTCTTQASSLADTVRGQNAKHKVVVYSKSYCPYCAQVTLTSMHLHGWSCRAPRPTVSFRYPRPSLVTAM